MNKCAYFRSETIKYKSNQGNLNRAPNETHVSEIYWCLHPKHAPVVAEQAHSLSGVKLTCSGIVDECPLSSDQYHDRK